MSDAPVRPGPVAEAGQATPGTRSDWASMSAAALAAMAEAGIIFLPMRQLLRENGHTQSGPFASYGWFLLIFVGGVALATGLRRRRASIPAVGLGALVLAAVQILAFASADAPAAAFITFLVVLVALRVTSLAFREWQDPVAESFAVGAGVLLLEAASASGFDPAWRALLPVVVPQFFLASLASRAASLRLLVPTGSGAEHERAAAARRLAMAAAAAAVLAALLAFSAALGGHGGFLQTVGRLAYDVVEAVLSAVAFVVARVIMPPLGWVLRRFHIDLSRAQQRLRSFNRPGERFRVPAATPGWARIVGFLSMTAFVGALLWIIKNRWLRWIVPESPPPHRQAAPPTPLAGRLGRRRLLGRAHRWEPPADTVRRWYADALVLLSRRGLDKPPWLTPGEFAPVVGRVFPDCAFGFEALTRAYEQVRYGARTVERATLETLSPRWELAMETFRTKPRPDQPDEPDGG